MRFYQMDHGAVASQFNSDLAQGLQLGESSSALKKSTKGAAILREIGAILRAKLYFVDVIILVGYAVSVIFSLLNKNYGLLWLTLGCLGFSVLFIALQLYFLAAYKVGYYTRLNQHNQSVSVIRNGKETVVLSADLREGDLLRLEKGTILYADARIISCDNLFADESLVFGSTISAEKISDAICENNLAPEMQRNMLWKGSFVSGGTGLAMVVAVENDCYLAKTGGRKTKKQHSFFYTMQNNIGRIISYLYVILLGLSMLISVVFSNRYIEAFLMIAVLSSLIALDPISCLIEWCYYRTAKKLATQGIFVRNIEAFDRMNREKNLYYNSSALANEALSFSQVMPLIGTEKNALSYFSLCVGGGALCDSVSRELEKFGVDFAQLNQEYPVFRREEAENGNVFTLFSQSGSSVALSVGYWKNMVPYLTEQKDAEWMASVSELEQHGKMVFLLGTHSMDFIPTKLDVHAFEGKMTAYALVVFQIPCQTEVLDQIHRLRRTKMKVTLINRYSSVLGEYLMRSYDMDDVCETPPREPSYSLPCNGENSPLVSVSATPIEREQAMVVVEEGISPQKLVYDVKCMFCGIRRCLHFLASTALYAVLCSLILFLRGVAVQNIVIPALLIYPALVCVCYYLIETVRNCNQYTRSLVLGAFCGLAGVVAAAVGLNMAPFTYMLSVFFLALYLFFARKPFSFSVKDGALLGACLAVTVLPWFFLGGNWLPAAIMALYPAAAAFILDRFY